MNLRPLTPDETKLLVDNQVDPSQYVADDNGQAIHRSAIASMGAPALQQQLGLNEWDATQYAKRGPISSALTEGLNRLGAGMFSAGAKLTGSTALEEQRAKAQNVAEYLASKRQPGALDTALGLGAALGTYVPMYAASFPAAAAITAASSGGEGAQLTKEAGGGVGQQAANALMRGGTSALTDWAGAKYAVPLAKGIMQSARPSLQRAGALAVPGAVGAAENVAATLGANVADRVTFDPQQDLTEGVTSSALVGAAVPVAAGAVASRQARTATPSRGQILGEGSRLPFAERAAYVERINKEYPALLGGEGPLTAQMLGGAEGNRMADADIVALMNLASSGPEATTPFASRNQKLLADAVRAGYVDPTGIDVARRILNEGPTAFADVQAKQAGAAAEARLAELKKAQQQAQIGAVVESDARALAKAEARPVTEQQAVKAVQGANQVAQLQDAAAQQAITQKAAGVAQNVETGVPAGETIVTGAKAQMPTPTPAPENATTAGNAKTAVTTAPTTPPVGKDAANNVNKPSQAGTGPTVEATKSAPAPTSTPLPKTGTSPTSRALQLAEGTSKNPSAAAVVEAGASKEAGFESAVDMDRRFAREAVARLNRMQQRKEARETSAIRPAPSVEQNALFDRAMQLHAEGRTAEAEALLASGTSALPKDKVAAPVATVESKPAQGPITVEAWRGTPEGGSKQTQDGRNFYAAKETTAKEYGPNVTKNTLTFDKPLYADNHLDAKKKLGLPASTLMPELFGAAENAGHDGIVWKHHGETEYVALRKPASTPEMGEAAEPGLAAKVFGGIVPDAFGPTAQVTVAVNTKQVKGQTKADLINILPEAVRSAVKDVALTRGSVLTTGAKSTVTPAKIKFTANSLDDARAIHLALGGDGKTTNEKVTKPAPLKIKRAADPAQADRAVLDAAGLIVRKKPDGSWELYDKSIDEVVRPLGQAADEAEAIGLAARSAKGGLGSKMKPTTGEEGFILNPGEAIEKAARAVGGTAATAWRSAAEKIRSATNQLGDYATRTGDEVGKYAHEKVNKMATVGAIDGNKIINENQRIWSKLSSAELAELTDIIQYERAWQQRMPGRHSPKVQAAYDEFRQQIRELGERAGREGPMIKEGGEWRPLIVDEFWAPEVLSQATLKRLQNLDTREAALQEYRDWARDKGLDAQQIDTEIKRFDIESKTADADLEFDALHKPMTIPLPPGWAGNAQDAFNRYAMKYAFDMARHKIIDQDPTLGPMSRGQRESLDELGRPTTRPEEAGQVGDNVDSLFRAALNSFALQLNPGRRVVTEQLSTLANRGAVQTAAHVVDTVNMLPNTIADAGVKNAMRGLIDGVTRYNDFKSRGLVRDTGNMSGDIQRAAEAWQGPGVRSKIAALNELMSVGGRVSGVDIMNKFMQAASAAAGVARAKEALAQADDAFFKKVGLNDWRSMKPAEVEEFVAKWVTEGSQGSGGAKDTPTHMLRAGGTGRTFYPILRWAFNYTNQQIDRAFKPLTDSSLKPLDRVMPLAVRMIGAAGAKELATMLVGALFGRDDRTVSYDEWDAAGKPNPVKYIAQRATDLQMLPAVMTFANVLAGNSDLPRNLGMELLPRVGKQLTAMAETKRDLTAEDVTTAFDAVMDTFSSNWRDVSKMASDQTRDPIEQARMRYNSMNQATTFNAVKNPLNLGTRLNEAKTEAEVIEAARKILATATLETPTISVAGPDQDAAFAEWLKRTDPALYKDYVKKNLTMGVGADSLYNTKKAVGSMLNDLLEEKKKLLMSKEPDALKRAKALSIDWKTGGMQMK